MTRRNVLRAASFASFAALVSLLGCLTEQDLGSHAPPPDAGLGAFPFFDATLPPDPNVGAKIFFVTNGRYTGDLATEGGAASGLQGADAICTKEARDAGLRGAFKAWLSTTAENANRRISPVGPWRSTGDTSAFTTRSVTLPWGPPRYNAAGGDLLFTSERNVWTGTSEDGTRNPKGNACAAWTSGAAADQGSYGDMTFWNGSWTDVRAIDKTSESKPCSDRLRLYCFEQ